MEALGIAASLVALIQIADSSATTLRRRIGDYRAAPMEYLALSNEINDLKLFLTHLEATLQLVRSSPGLNADLFITALQPELLQAKKIFSDLDALLKTLAVVASSGEAKVSRHRWIWRSSQATRLRGRLRDSKINLTALLSAFTCNQNVGTQAVLLQVQRTTLHISAQQRQMAFAMGHGFPWTESNWQEIAASNVQPDAGKAGQLPSATAPVAGNTLAPTPDGSQSGLVCSTESTALAPPLADDTRNSTLISARIRVSTRRGQICARSCSCSCHSFRPMHSPIYLTRFVGSLFVGYYGSPRPTDECNRPECRQRKRRTEVAYYFPVWFITQCLRGACLAASICSLGHTVNITVRARYTLMMNSCHNLLYCSRSGNIGAVKELLEKRQGSPFDTCELGFSALFFAISAGQYATAKFLLDQGADAHAQSDEGSTPYSLARSVFFSEASPTLKAQAVRDLFPGIGDPEQHDFSIIHQTVLGLNKLQLESVLKTCHKATTVHDIVNLTDANGLSPLWWAARRADAEAVSALLAHGADSRIQSTWGSNCLFGVLQRDDAQALLCLQALLTAKAKADPNVMTRSGLTPLHIAVEMATEGLDMVRALISAGAKCEVPGLSYSLLQYACTARNPEAFAFLLEQGADPNWRDRDGDTCMADAIVHRRYDAVDLLLERGMDYGTINARGDNLLHLMAEVCDKDVVEIMTTKGLHLLDPNALNKSSMTPWDVCKMRMDPPQGFEIAFGGLLQSIRALRQRASSPERNASGVENGEMAQHDDDVWYDAHQYQDGG